MRNKTILAAYYSILLKIIKSALRLLLIKENFMKKILSYVMFLGIGLGMQAQDDLIAKVKDQGATDAEKGFQFTLVKDLKATPVKNQGSSGTCWSYSSTSFVESELLRMGKKQVDISELFTVRQVYIDKAERYVRLNGYLNYAQGGAMPDVFYVLKKYGAVPNEVYKGLNYGETINKHNELEAVLKGMLDAVIKNPNKRLSTAWKPAVEAVLDQYLGAYPKEFFWEGKKYTPRTFVDNYLGINPDDYIQFSSYTHAPFYQEMFIEVPDNWNWGTAYNLPLDEMMEVVNFALDKDYTLSWATDVSEKGFSIKNGLAIVPQKAYEEMTADERAAMFEGPKPEMEITPEVRQRAYDNYETTDDHGMHITGMAKDQNGNVYYLVKNSWGEIPNANRNGYLYASEAFLRYKTISFMVHKSAVPKHIAKKLGL